MAKDITVASASINLTPLDIQGNVAKIKELLSEAKEFKVDLLCLPELCISGYGCEDGFLFPSVENASVQALLGLIPLTKDITVTFGLPFTINNKLYNCIALVSNCRLLGLVCKRHLANDGIHYETRWFNPWPKNEVVAVKVGNHECQAGDIVFDILDTKIGFEICEDAWVTDRNASSLSERGVQIILNPSASHFALGKRKLREEIVLTASKQYNVTYIYANVLGNEAGKVIYDGDTIIAKNGVIIADGKRFSFHDWVLTKTTISSKNEVGPSDLSNYEEFTYAVSLGLFDYLRKSKSNGFTISLSGGADSSATALLANHALRLSFKELGEKKFKGKLNYIEGVSSFNSYDSLVKRLIVTVYQETENSSEKTFNAARDVAQVIGASFHKISIDQIVGQYLSIAESIIKRKLDWSTDDIALQNIQARVRSPGIWLIANITRSLLLTTSNRSEGIVGYATMDGDTSGSLAPIAGVSKHFIKEWLRWMESHGVKEIGAYPVLSCVNSLIPTAELRPESFHQTDEKDLMPYELLDFFERALLQDRLSHDAILNLAMKKFRHYDSADISSWLVRFYELLRVSQWKRERLAPSFHLDTFNIDPRSGFRFPILSKGLM